MIRLNIVILLLLSNLAISAVHIGPGQKYSNIQLATNAGTVLPGDTVYLHAGSYSGYQGVSQLKGNESNWIVITRFGNDAIDIAGTWQFMSCEYIKFVNLKFKANAKSPGRLLSIDNSGSCTTQSRFIKVDSCEFSDVTDINSITAFKFGGVDDFEVTNCRFHDFKVCDAMDFNVCHRGIIRGNILQNCLTGGHIKGGASDITMERNLFINSSMPSWVAFELGGDTGAQFYCPEDKFEVKNLKFYSNIIVGGYRGLALSSAVDCKVINNTFFNCGQATLRFLTTSNLYPTLSGNKIENNIFAFGTSAYINGGTQPATAASFGKNIYYSIISTPFNGPYWDTPDLDAMKDRTPINVGSDIPMFADTANLDFSLRKGSPAIGTGITELEPLTDFYGNRFSEKSRSIGAIEANIFDEVTTDKAHGIIISPNPALDFIELKNVPNEKIEVFSIEGIKVISINSNENASCRIDIRALLSGLYYIKIGSKVQNFIKI